MSEPVVSGRAVTLLIAIGALAFAGMGFLLIYADELGSRTAGPSGYSVSAIGHGAFVELLRDSGVPVLVSRHDSVARAGAGNLLVAAEPESVQALRALAPEPAGELEAVLQGPLLVVLPRRTGRPAWENDRWLGSDAMLGEAVVAGVLRTLDPGAGLVRPDQPVSFATNQLGFDPALDAPQLMTSSRMRPVVAGEQGILVGELRSGRQTLWVLADPDVIATHGIGKGDNAAFALALVDTLRPADGTVVMDETIHGFVSEPSLWKAALEPPFVLATVQAVAALAVLLWATVGRFGPPLEAERAIVPGAATLLDTGANLLKPDRHGGTILRRYADAVLREVGDRLHAPRQFTSAQRGDWLDRLGRSRRAGDSWQALAAEVAAAEAAGQPSRLTAVAARLHRWKKDMLDGS
jgi:hypothetical protein